MVRRCQAEPEWFFEHVLGIHPWQKQTQIARSVRDHERTAIKSGNGTGKTYISGAIVLWFLYSFPPSKVVTTAPTDRQVTDLLWSEVATIYGRSKLPLAGRLLTKFLELEDNWFAVGFATREYDPEKFQGYHAPHMLVIFDEASGIPAGIWNGAEGLLTSGHSRFLAIGNPTDPTSEFAKCFRANSGWQKDTISCWDTPNVQAGKNVIPGLVSFDWPQKKLEQWGENSSAYRIKVLGEFPESGDDTLIPLHLIEQARNRDLPEGSPCELGNDVAYGGNDKSVFIIRRGSKVVHIGEIDVRDTTHVAGKAHRLATDLGVENIKVDVIGIGAGVHDQLAGMAAKRYIVSPVNVAEKATDPERYLNRRAEYYDGLRQRFIDGDISMPADDELEEELATIRYKFNSRGQMQIEAKDDMKKRLGRSPDKADALMLAFAVPQDAPWSIPYAVTPQKTMADFARLAVMPPSARKSHWELDE